MADLLGLNGGEAIFIDELHSLGSDTAEYFQLAMEGVDPAHGTTMVPWTLVAATTKLGEVPQPIRDRFGLLLHLSFYPQSDMEKIAAKSAQKLNMTLRPKSAVEIAERARGVPRIGNRLLKRVRDVTDEPTPKQVAETLLELVHIRK